MRRSAGRPAARSEPTSKRRCNRRPNPPAITATDPMVASRNMNVRRSSPTSSVSPWGSGWASPCELPSGRERTGFGPRYQSTAIDTAVPTIVGSSLPSVGAGRVSTAKPPMIPITLVRAYAPARAPRIAMIPTVTPSTSTTTIAPAMSTALSFVPNCSMAQSFIHFGTWSMNSCPTGTTGDADPSTSPTTTSAAARPAPVATRPRAAPSQFEP